MWLSVCLFVCASVAQLAMLHTWVTGLGLKVRLRPDPLCSSLCVDDAQSVVWSLRLRLAKAWGRMSCMAVCLTYYWLRDARAVCACD